MRLALRALAAAPAAAAPAALRAYFFFVAGAAAAEEAATAPFFAFAITACLRTAFMPVLEGPSSV